MWIPGGLYHLAAALWFLARSLDRLDVQHPITAPKAP
jgi:hypothetical protein